MAAAAPSATTHPQSPPPPASASGSCASRPSRPPPPPHPSASSPSGVPTSSRYVPVPRPSHLPRCLHPTGRTRLGGEEAAARESGRSPLLSLLTQTQLCRSLPEPSSTPILFQTVPLRPQQAALSTSTRTCLSRRTCPSSLPTPSGFLAGLRDLCRCRLTPRTACLLWLCTEPALRGRLLEQEPGRRPPVHVTPRLPPLLRMVLQSPRHLPQASVPQYPASDPSSVLSPLPADLTPRVPRASHCSGPALEFLGALSSLVVHTQHLTHSAHPHTLPLQLGLGWTIPGSWVRYRWVSCRVDSQEVTLSCCVTQCASFSASGLVSPPGLVSCLPGQAPARLSGALPSRPSAPRPRAFILTSARPAHLCLVCLLPSRACHAPPPHPC